jgi:hypothetical protein
LSSSVIEAADPDTVPPAPDDPAGDVVLDYYLGMKYPH